MDASATKIYIYGNRSDGNEAFAKFYTTSPILDLELRRGDWTFYVLTYTGTDISQCGKITSELGRKKTFLKIEISNAKCADPIFLGTNSALDPIANPAVDFSPTAVEFCESIEGIESSTDQCTDDLGAFILPAIRKQARGHAGSFRYVFQGFEKTKGIYNFTDSFVSSCRPGVPAPASLRGLSSSFMGFDVPAGDESLTPFYIKLEIFPLNDNCTSGTPHTVHLPHGLRSNVGITRYVIDPAGGPSHKIYVKSSGEEICTGLNNTSEFAGGTGDIDRPWLICNETQLYNIFPEGSGNYSTHSSKSYKLLKNIDLSAKSIPGNFTPEWQGCVGAGSNWMPIGTSFPGCVGSAATDVHFDGGGKTIKGMRIRKIPGQDRSGLYYSLRRTGGNTSQVRRITFEDSQMTASSFVGTITGDGQNAFFRQIKLINPVVTAANSIAGGITGISQGDTIEDIEIVNADIDGLTNIGGVTGAGTKFGIPTTITRAFVDGSIYSPSNNIVGGLAGTFGGDVLSTISESRFIGQVEGSSIVGGLVGLGLALKIKDSYAVGTGTGIKSRATVGAQSGGLVGAMNGRLADASSGIETSYFYGNITENCTLNNDGCLISTIVGSPILGILGYTAAEFPSVVYNTSSQILFNATNFGHVQPDAQFLLSMPSFVDDTMTPIVFDTDIWEFRNGQLPKLKAEP